MIDQPDVELTLILPLKAKQGMPLEDFYDYWLNAHVTLPPRFPGISSIWLHVVSFDADRWPRTDGVSHRPEPEDEFHGVPEATFPSLDDLGQFQAYSHLQMEDGKNFLAEQLAYRSLGRNSRTVVDTSANPTPDGSDSLVRHLVFLRRRPEVSEADFRRFVTDTLVASYARSPHVRKLRRHLFEEVELTLDHPDVAMFKPVERQYQAALEVVVSQENDLAEFAASPAWTDVVDGLRSHCEAVHGVRVQRCITTKYRGQITLAGVRGIAVADVVRRVGADNQRGDDIAALFLPVPTWPLGIS